MALTEKQENSCPYIYLLGEKAFRDNVGDELNPFNPSTQYELWSNWNSGWWNAYEKEEE